MRIWHNSFSHGSRQKRNPRRFHQLTHLILSSAISAALANDNQRSLELSQHANGSLHFCQIRPIHGWRDKQGKLDRVVNRAHKYVSREIEIDWTWSACYCSLYCFLHVIRDLTRIGDSCAVLYIGFNEIRLVNLLKGLFWRLVEVIWATD